ncbi:hypothetical protein ACG0Z6_00120 [Roseateles sp. BYS180W]|uniref:Chemotaxis protein n=1 Tax=Roseateles rivi TaxID=3299028 RepID=A0ABW7FQQ1_9BURK
MNSRIEKTLLLVQQAQKAWDELYALMRDSGLLMDRSYASLQRSSIDELNERLAATFLLADGLRNIEDSAVTLLAARLPSIEGPLSQIHQHADVALSQLRSFADATLSDPSGNLTVQVMRGGSVYTNWFLGGNLDPIAAQQTVLLDQLTLGLRFGRYKGVGLFQERARELQTMAAELAKLLEQSRSIVTAVHASRAAADTVLQQAQSDVDAVRVSREQVNSAALESQQALEEIRAKLARVREITQASDSLSTQVDDYGASFEAFKESLDARVAAHQKFAADMVEATAANKTRESEIDALIGRADTMIRGATTAGLSNSLDEARCAYEARLKTTGWWFLGSVAVLLLCLLPIAGQLIPGPWQLWFQAPSGGNSDPWLATLGKVILLLPATWATAFFAGNYAELFHLSREYAHKAAMAKAVDGFKREAPEYREEIVAGVFMEIRDNPGSRKSPPAATPQNPIAQKILEKLLEAVRAKKGE